MQLVKQSIRVVKVTFCYIDSEKPIPVLEMEALKVLNIVALFATMFFLLKLRCV